MIEKNVVYLFELIENDNHEDLEKFLASLQPNQSSSKNTLFLTKLFKSDPRKELMHCKNKGGLTPLVAAVRTGSLLIVQALIDAGADVNEGATLRERSLTPLIAAIEQDNAAVVELLVDSGVNVNLGVTHINGNWQYPIITAAIKGNSQIIDRLLKARVVLGVLDRDGNSVVHHAVLHENPDVLSQLITAKADIHKLNKTKSTPFQLAAWERTRCFELLLDAGAGLERDINLTPKEANFTNSVVIGLKIRGRSKKFENAIHTPAEFLRAVRRGVDFNRNALFESCELILKENNENKIIKKFQEALWYIPLTSDLSKEDKDVIKYDDNLMCQEVESQKHYQEIIKQSRSGKGIEEQALVNEHGESPLHLLIRYDAQNNLQLIRDLVDRCKLNPDCKDSAGFTPLQYFLNNFWIGHVPMIMNFLRLGANPLSTNSKGKSVLELLQEANSITGSLNSSIAELNTYIEKHFTPPIDLNSNLDCSSSSVPGIIIDDEKNLNSTYKILINDLEDISPSVKVIFLGVVDKKERLLSVIKPQYKVTFALAVLYVYWNAKLSNANDLVLSLLQSASWCLQNDPILQNYPESLAILDKLKSAEDCISRVKSSEVPADPSIAMPVPYNMYYVNHPLAIQEEAFLKLDDEKEITELNKEFMDEGFKYDIQNSLSVSGGIGQFGLLSKPNNTNNINVEVQTANQKTPVAEFRS